MFGYRRVDTLHFLKKSFTFCVECQVLMEPKYEELSEPQGVSGHHQHHHALMEVTITFWRL